MSYTDHIQFLAKEYGISFGIMPQTYVRNWQSTKTENAELYKTLAPDITWEDFDNMFAGLSYQGEWFGRPPCIALESCFSDKLVFGLDISDSQYAVALHEIGHYAADPVHLAGIKHPITLFQELLAWQWALETCSEWTARMHQVLMVSLSTYGSWVEADLIEHGYSVPDVLPHLLTMADAITRISLIKMGAQA